MRHLSTGTITILVLLLPTLTKSFSPPRLSMTTTDEVSSTLMDDGGDSPAAAVWDPVQQIYVGGRVPDSGDVQALIQATGNLPIFGYGSLCWKPGGILGEPTVTRQFGKAVGYRRCWCQKSTDHRGVPPFPGIVCTLLKDEEVETLVQAPLPSPSRTEGVLYTVPAELVEDCLAELDFREKGGYAREVIQVVLDDTGETVQAALYRGTPDNPAIWPRVLRDHVYAAAVLKSAVGPSGPNTEYLHNLHAFLQQHKDPTTVGEEDTFDLTRLVDSSNTRFHFLYGAGSNQHNQLLLQHYSKYLVNGEEAHGLEEVLVGTKHEASTKEADDVPAALYAGGGHSALLTTNGRLHLFGWNEAGQCGEYSPDESDERVPLEAWEVSFEVKSCALGFAHTLVLDTSCKLHALGDNDKGQVTGTASTTSVRRPVIPEPVQNVEVTHMAAGLFHSACVTRQGHVVTWGGGGASHSTWIPPDNGRAVGVACGRKYTIVWTENGSLYSWGADNKYGQLGRDGMESTEIPALISAPWSSEEYRIIDIQTGWSHTVVLLEHVRTNERVLYGWGRAERGQLGLGHADARSSIHVPTRLPVTNVQSFSCGSEFTVAVDTNGRLLACGWNEHGNLGYAAKEFSTTWQSLSHPPLVQPPGTPLNDGDYAVCLVAAGGSHFLAARIAPRY